MFGDQLYPMLRGTLLGETLFQEFYERHLQISQYVSKAIVATFTFDIMTLPSYNKLVLVMKMTEFTSISMGFATASDALS